MNPFKKIKCSNCNKEYEESFYACPMCGAENKMVSNHHIRMNSLSQILSFVIGCIGFLLVGAFAQIFIIIAVQNNGFDIKETWVEVLVAMLTNIITYVVISIALGIFLIKDYKEIFKSFKAKELLFGLLLFMALLILNYIVGFIKSGYCSAVFSKEEMETIDNLNQKGVKDLVVNYPIVAFFMVVVFAPIVEEITYRLGLFSFLRKINFVLALLVSSFAFGMIHFGYSALTSGDIRLIVVELISLLFYVGSGVLMGFFYHKFGFFTSWSGHALNNLFSFVSTLVATYFGKKS